MIPSAYPKRSEGINHEGHEAHEGATGLTGSCGVDIKSVNDTGRISQAIYADGLEKYGYRDSPLEVMAYDAEEAFARGGEPFDAEKSVRGQLARLG